MQSADWQRSAIAQAHEALSRMPGITEVWLHGSLADPRCETDYWSDIDLIVVASRDAGDRLMAETGWLVGLGRIIGCERYDESREQRLLRVCFDGLRRMDVKISALGGSVGVGWELLWSALTSPRDPAAAAIPAGAPWDPDEETAHRFWFAAAVAVAKLMRRDALIGLHLALGLQRSCLELVMVRRDLALGTTIHRQGSEGEAIGSRLATGAISYSPAEIMDIIVRCCGLYDELAPAIWPSYRERSTAVSAAFERARTQLRQPGA